MLSIYDIFDESYYLETNSEIAELITNRDYANGLEHFEAVGIDEGLRFSPFIDLDHYKRFANPELSKLTNREALTHLLKVGIEEGLIFSPLIDLDFYKEANPDLSNLSNSNALIHLRDIGINERRQFSPLIDLEDYQSDFHHFSLLEVFTYLATFCTPESMLLVLAPPPSTTQKNLQFETRPQTWARRHRRNANLRAQASGLSRREKEKPKSVTDFSRLL